MLGNESLLSFTSAVSDIWDKFMIIELKISHSDQSFSSKSIRNWTHTKMSPDNTFKFDQNFLECTIL